MSQSVAIEYFVLTGGNEVRAGIFINLVVTLVVAAALGWYVGKALGATYRRG